MISTTIINGTIPALTTFSSDNRVKSWKEKKLEAATSVEFSRSGNVLTISSGGESKTVEFNDKGEV